MWIWRTWGRIVFLLQSLGMVDIRLCLVLVRAGRIMMIVIFWLWAPMMLQLITWDTTWFTFCHKSIKCGSCFKRLI